MLKLGGYCLSTKCVYIHVINMTAMALDFQVNKLDQ